MSGERAVLRTVVLVFLVTLAGVEPGISIRRAQGTVVVPGSEGRLTFIRIKHLGAVPYDVHEAIFTMEPDGTDAGRLYDAGSSLLGSVTWSPDGTQVMFDEMTIPFGPCDIQLMNADGSGLATVLSTDIQDCAGGPEWSPNGSRILLFQGLNLFTMAPNGTGLVQLTSFDRPGAYLDGWDWSPDGTRIVFARETPRGVGRLFVMNADGSEITQIAACYRPACLGGEPDAEPEWSPDGAVIAFARARNIYVIRADGGRPNRLTQCREAYLHRHCTKSTPVWSPDGTRIAFRAGDGRILLMDRDGSNIVRLPQERAYLRAWRPPVVA